MHSLAAMCWLQPRLRCKGQSERQKASTSIRNRLALAACLAVAFKFVAWAAAAPTRPKITGISHVAYFVFDLPKRFAFWHDFLGFDEAYSLKKKDSEEVRIAFIKINDRQHIELLNEPPPIRRT